MKRLLSATYLNAISGVIALGILAISANTLWNDRLDTWMEAERASRNLLTAIAHDLTTDLELMDLSLKGVIDGLQYVGFQKLPPDLKYRLLFDRATSPSFMESILVLNEAGNLIADAGPVIVPRNINVADREYFTAHKEKSHIGLYVSRPFRPRFGEGTPSLSLSRRLLDSDGRFAGVVMGTITLSNITKMFDELHIGRSGTINLFRSDGILLTRYPFDENQIDQDFSGSPYVQRLIREKSGTFDSVSPIDGVHRVISFERLDRFPLVLTVALSLDEVFAAWKRKALVLSLVTGVLCSAVVSLTILFQRELRRRTSAETKLRRLAKTDDLTRLPNRRAFRENFDREWRQAIRSVSTLSMLYVDVDYFKGFNDRYGHGRGDEVLRGIGRTLHANIRRPRDIAARYGGEEFAILLPETDPAGAQMLAENIRRAVMAADLPHEGSPYQIVTVSIGVASAQPSSGTEWGVLLEAADQALYQAKAAGRNCVHVLAAPGTAVQEQPLTNTAE